MHYEEDQRVWVLGADEPVAYCDVAADEMGQGQEGAEQCVFLV